MDKLDMLRKVIFTAVLIFVLLMLLTWSNILKCGVIPGWCDTYWGVVGDPKVLIAHGNDGLGNPEKLEDIFMNRDILGKRTTLRNIDYLTSGVLSKYELVIVTRAKTMSVEKLEMFLDYANKGGKLVWTGDAGTTKFEGEKNLSDYNLEEYDTNIDTAGWMRINKDGKVINFNEKMSADYIGNYCDMAPCSGENSFVGHLNHYDDSIISKELKQKSELSSNFAIVSLINNTSTKIDLILDTRSNLIVDDINHTNHGKEFPIIITSGLGDKIIYSAVPLEYFVDLEYDESKTDNGMFYATIIENIYENMIRGKNS